MRLRDRVAIITGGGGGMGRGIASVLAREGARVAAADLNLRTAEATAQALRDKGGQAIAVEMDVTRRESIDAAVHAAEQAFGEVDILVNNAGINQVIRFEELSEADWERVLRVNLTGVFLCSQAVLPALRRRGGGRIINIASTAAATGAVMSGAHYTASKAGVVGLTKQLAKELAADRILVNAIMPGFIDTDMLRALPQERLQQLLPTVLLGRVGTPEEVGAAVLFLASEDSRYVTGTVLNVSAGQLMQ